MLSLPEHAAVTQDMEPHWRTLMDLARFHDSVLELGVRTGVSTWAILDAIKPDARLTSVDIEECDVPERVRKDPRWTFIHGDDREPVVQRAMGGATMAFIDTTHEYGHTLTELQVAAQHGAELIVLHDWSISDVEDAAYGFCRRNPYHLTGIEPSQWGMAWLSRS